jgi:hypothetical protein
VASRDNEEPKGMLSNTRWLAAQHKCQKLHKQNAKKQQEKANSLQKSLEACLLKEKKKIHARRSG